MLGGDALDLEIAILQHGEVRRDLAKGFIWFLSGSNPMMCSRRGHRRLSQARQMALRVMLRMTRFGSRPGLVCKRVTHPRQCQCQIRTIGSFRARTMPKQKSALRSSTKPG